MDNYHQQRRHLELQNLLIDIGVQKELREEIVSAAFYCSKIQEKTVLTKRCPGCLREVKGKRSSRKPEREAVRRELP